MVQKFNWLDRNAFIHLGLLAVIFYLTFVVSAWCLLLYPAFLIFSDVLYYYFGVAIFDPEEVVQKGYQVSAIFNETLHSEGIDYGFNFYNGDYKKSRQQAQIDKFEYAIKELKLKPGMAVIDIGCGCGDWLSYLKKKGINVTGINITYEQVEECKKRGLDVIWSNWKDIDKNQELQEKLYDKYDAVTFWDTVEHYVPMKYRNDNTSSDKIYSDMFTLTKNLINPESDSGRVFISCLHMRQHVGSAENGIEKLKKMYYCYLLDKFHSGCYPSGENDQLVRNAKGKFELEDRLDTTMDYYMTSILEPTHFGVHQFRWTPKRLAFAFYIFLTDPHWFQRLLWYYTSNWMFQFDEKNIENSDMLHWWLTFHQIKKRGSHG